MTDALAGSKLLLLILALPVVLTLGRFLLARVLDRGRRLRRPRSVPAFESASAAVADLRRLAGSSRRDFDRRCVLWTSRFWESDDWPGNEEVQELLDEVASRLSLLDRKEAKAAIVEALDKIPDQSAEASDV